MDVIIVGGGVIGLSCAWRMAQRGAKVRVLERRKCGEGATLASLGALWPAAAGVDGPLQKMQRESLWGYEEFVREVEGASGGTIRFERRGRIELLRDEKAVADARRDAAIAEESWPRGLRSEMGVVQEVVGPEVVEKIEPSVRAEGQCGVVCRITAQVRVEDLVAGLKGACERAGVVIEEGVAVTKVPSAERVVLCTGAWTALVDPAVTAAIKTKPAKGQGLALKTKGAVISRIIKREKIYLVPWGEEILVGSTTEPEAGFDEGVTEAARAMLFEWACDIVPALKGAEIVRHWAGLRPDARKHQPIMERLNGTNVWVCAGHFKTGIGLSALVGRMMAERVLGADGASS